MEPEECEPFSCSAWCDDYICVEPDVGTRLAEANIALRASMVDVLGSLACNDDKFSLWFINGKALGFNWSLLDGTLSMPSEKITKARTRVLEVINGTHTTRHQLDQLLGSLRHVTTCVRPAAAFSSALRRYIALRLAMVGLRSPRTCAMT